MRVFRGLRGMRQTLIPVYARFDRREERYLKVVLALQQAATGR